MASQIYGFHEVQKIDALAECENQTQCLERSKSEYMKYTFQQMHERGLNITMFNTSQFMKLQNVHARVSQLIIWIIFVLVSFVIRLTQVSEWPLAWGFTLSFFYVLICFCLDSLMELTDLFCMPIPDYYNFIILNSAFDILGRSGSIISLIDVFKGYTCMHAVIFTDCLITKFVLLVHFLSFGAAWLYSYLWQLFIQQGA